MQLAVQQFTLNYWKYVGAHEKQQGTVYFKFALIAGYDRSPLVIGLFFQVLCWFVCNFDKLATLGIFYFTFRIHF